MALIPAPEEERERVVLFVGAPWYLKGVDLLIDAFRRIASEFPDVTLRIQGCNADIERLRAMAADVPRVEIVRAVPNPETLRRISRALLLVLPSRCEGLGRVLIEAMSAGVATIGSDAGGTPHCISDGENGLLFPAGNAEELSKRMRELLSNDELRNRLGRRAYEMAHPRFTEQVYVQQFARMVELATKGETA